MRVAVVAGNLKPGSRTLDAAIRAASLLTGSEPDTVVDVITLGAGLLSWDDPAVKEAIASVQESSVVVFASPTYKASFTGVLKLFLDLIPSKGLTGIVAVPLMLGAGPAHALAPELTLKPVLVELGALCPTPGLYLLDSTYAEEGSMDTWLATAAPAVAALAHAGLARTTPLAGELR